MRSLAIGGNVKDAFGFAVAALRRGLLICRNGGFEDLWTPLHVGKTVVDLNTRMPISGFVMQKVVDGRPVYRQMTEEERSDFDASRHW